MNVKNIQRLLPVVLILAFAVTSAFAKAGKQVSGKVSLDTAATINGTALPAGNYSVTWSSPDGSPTVSFTKGKQTVATAPAKWVNRTTKYDENQVLYSKDSKGSSKIVEIRFAGSNQALVFGDEDSGS